MERLYVCQFDQVETDRNLPNRIKIPLALVQQFAAPFLVRTDRPNYDFPHTLSVDYFAALLSRDAGQDELVLRTVAWLHDIGGYDIAKYGYPRKFHMFYSALRTGEFFSVPEMAQYYSPGQIDRIIHIISVHDKIEELKDPDELIFMEADLLGNLNTHAGNLFNTIQIKEYMIGRIDPTRTRFITPLAKNLLARLLDSFGQPVVQLKYE